MEGTIKKLARPVRAREDLDDLVKKLSSKRVVMLGEATHGTEEFYELRKVLSQKLIEDYGFKFIAVEGDWPDCFKLNKHIYARTHKNALQIMHTFERWPTWMWGNYQTAELIEWMKGRNAGFYGLDVYSLYDSLEVIRSYAGRVDDTTAENILAAYHCFETYHSSEIEYAKKAGRWPSGCQFEIMRALTDVLKMRIEETTLLNEEYFDIQQNARVVKNADKYYDAMLYGGANSWNVRDEHMMDTLDDLLQHHGEGAKAIVWAHNTHIGDYRATDMIDEGYVNLGGLARLRYGPDNIALVGFGTYEGEVLAGQAWGREPQKISLRPAKENSYEAAFHKVSKNINARCFYISMNQERELKERKGHRAVGVVYQTIYEDRGHNYVPTILAERYDDFIFVDTTTALKAVHTDIVHGVLPETWPSGV